MLHHAWHSTFNIFWQDSFTWKGQQFLSNDQVAIQGPVISIPAHTRANNVQKASKYILSECLYTYCLSTWHRSSGIHLHARASYVHICSCKWHSSAYKGQVFPYAMLQGVFVYIQGPAVSTCAPASGTHPHTRARYVHMRSCKWYSSGL